MPTSTLRTLSSISLYWWFLSATLWWTVIIDASYSHSLRNGSGPIIFADGKTLAEVIFSETGEIIHCRLHELQEPSDADPIIKNSGLPAKYPSFNNMLDLINNCSQLEIPMNNITSVIATDQSQVPVNQWTPWAVWNGIVPGTKWCGVGDIASTFEELGSQSAVDSCCRSHDHCPVKLKAFRVGYGLINLSLYTKSHCDCDMQFYSCLKQSKNKFADVVGNFYFNLMRFQCLKEHRPFVCVQNSTEANGKVKCVRWSVSPDHSKMEMTKTGLIY